MDINDENSTSGALELDFVSQQDSVSEYEQLSARGFNALWLVRRGGRKMICKGLLPELQHDLRYVELLKKEFALTAQLDHPNIVRMFYKEQNPHVGPCLVMEYVDGESLRDALRDKDAKLKVRDKQRIAYQLLDALDYIHLKQIVHRDLKPSNILLTTRGRNVKLIDFGLSDADEYTVFKQPAGTPRYIAPEQNYMTGDYRSDLYSFGLILHELFPRRYRWVSRRCTQLEPSRRYVSARAVAQAMHRVDRVRRWHPWILLLLLAIGLSMYGAHEVRMTGGTIDTVYVNRSDTVLVSQKDTVYTSNTITAEPDYQRELDREWAQAQQALRLTWDNTFSVLAKDTLMDHKHREMLVQNSYSSMGVYVRGLKERIPDSCPYRTELINRFVLLNEEYYTKAGKYY